jgi:hypothetical protein
MADDTGVTLLDADVLARFRADAPAVLARWCALRLDKVFAHSSS